MVAVTVLGPNGASRTSTVELRPGVAPRAERALRLTVLVLEGVVAVAALGGGSAMVANPTDAMGLGPEMLDQLPVDSWLLPGVALIASNAVLPAAAAVGELRRRRWPHRFGHTVVGAVVLAWPVTETALFGYPLEGEPVWLRPAIAATGASIIVLGLLLRRRGASLPLGR